VRRKQVPRYRAEDAASRTGAELAHHSRAAQQLPPHVEDDVTLAQVAALLRNNPSHMTARAVKNTTTNDATEEAQAS
jgi:hypothetical protein